MASRSASRRLVRPFLYASAAALAGGGVLYFSIRPRNIPGSDPAAVPPPRYGEDGYFIPPRFPLVKTREEQLADLKKSSGVWKAAQETKGVIGSIAGSEGSKDEEERGTEEYDLLVIGGGATGSGIALDAVTRGLKVAMVDRDDFASGTSSKSTKLVHGGVRYLEKAVWELDYNQYVLGDVKNVEIDTDAMQIQTGEGSSPRTKVFFGYRTTSLELVTYYDTYPEMVAGPIFLGWYQVLRLSGWIRGH